MRALVGLWWSLVVVTQLACLAPTLKTYGRKPDVPAPPGLSKNVSFAPLLEQRVISNSVYTEPLERKLMTKVLLGPNLVFESSRSSLDEPDTVGPAGAGAGTPDQKNALGTPIQISLSSVLMNYLNGKGSMMLAPAVTRRFGWEWWCTKDWCPKTTWLERLMMLYGQAPRGDKGEKETATNWSGRELKLDDLPTSALAVRKLGIYVTRVPVTAVETSGGDIEFRPRQDASQPSVCAAELVVDVPVIAFSAELVSMKDGRILARIDEERSPRVSINPRRVVTAVLYEPVMETGFTVYQDNRPYDGKYQYVASWTEKRVMCAGAMSAYAEVSKELVRKLDAQLQPTVTELFKATLDQLYH